MLKNWIVDRSIARDFTVSISADLVNQKCRIAGWSCRGRKNWKACDNEKRLQETNIKLIEFCHTLCYCHDGILDVLAGKHVGKNCGNCVLVRCLNGFINKIDKVPAICTKSKSQCATKVNYLCFSKVTSRWVNIFWQFLKNTMPAPPRLKLWTTNSSFFYKILSFFANTCEEYTDYRSFVHMVSQKKGLWQDLSKVEKI